MVTKVDFLKVMAGRVVDVSVDSRIAAADKNGDGVIAGAAEKLALWKVIDGFENDGNPNRVQTTDASGQLTVPARLIRLVTDQSRPALESRISKKPDIAPLVKERYARYASSINFTKDNQRDYFGIVDGKRAIGWEATRQAFARYIVKTDPITGGPITFMGKPITGGVNVYALPLLKAAEASLRDCEYSPVGSTLGYGFRGMKFGGVESKSIISMHSSGLALDVDAGSNGPNNKNPHNNRGNIPDPIVFAMLDHGFVWGAVPGKGFEELSDDPMHFQFSMHPDHPRYKELIKSGVAKQYWDALAGQRVALPQLQTNS